MTSNNIPADQQALAAVTRSDPQRRAAEQRRRKRRNAIWAVRLLIFVVCTGGWELAARTGVLDPFFFSMPSAIAARLGDWIVNGTSQGSLELQIWTTCAKPTRP